jgi:hypothetical protein
MNHDQASLCRTILRALLRRPISKFFWAPFPPALTTTKRPPLSLRLIIERLDRGLYRAPGDWVGDMHVLLSYPAQRGRPSLHAAAARQLAGEFDALLQTLSPALSPRTVELQAAEARLGALLAPADGAPRPPMRGGGRPAAEALARPRAAAGDLARLAADIRSLFSPALILRVSAFVAAVEPPALVVDGDAVRILLLSMAPAARERLACFVAELTEAAAAGAVDPFVDRRPALLTQVI